MTPAASRRKAAAGSARTARQEGVGGRNAEPSSLAFFIFSWSLACISYPQGVFCKGIDFYINTEYYYSK